MRMWGRFASNLVVCIFTCFYPHVGCRVSAVVGCWFWLAVLSIDGYCYFWLPGVGCRVLTVDCRVQLSKVVVCCWFQGVGCRVLVFGWLYRVSLSCSIIGAHLWVSTTIYVSRSLNIFFFLYDSFPCSTPHWKTEKRGQNKRRKTILA